MLIVGVGPLCAPLMLLLAGPSAPFAVDALASGGGDADAEAAGEAVAGGNGGGDCS